MNITQLSEQYRATADSLQTRLAQLRGQLESARGEEALLLQRRIETMNAELLDLRIVMSYLRNYYA